MHRCALWPNMCLHVHIVHIVNTCAYCAYCEYHNMCNMCTTPVDTYGSCTYCGIHNMHNMCTYHRYSQYAQYVHIYAHMCTYCACILWIPQYAQYVQDPCRHIWVLHILWYSQYARYVHIPQVFTICTICAHICTYVHILCVHIVNTTIRTICARPICVYRYSQYVQYVHILCIHVDRYTQYVHRRLQVCTGASCARMHIHIYIRRYTHTYIHTQVYTYIYTYIHTISADNASVHTCRHMYIWIHIPGEGCIYEFVFIISMNSYSSYTWIRIHHTYEFVFLRRVQVCTYIYTYIHTISADNASVHTCRRMYIYEFIFLERCVYMNSYICVVCRNAQVCSVVCRYAQVRHVR